MMFILAGAAVALLVSIVAEACAITRLPVTPPHQGDTDD